MFQIFLFGHNPVVHYMGCMILSAIPKCKHLPIRQLGEGWKEVLPCLLVKTTQCVIVHLSACVTVYLIILYCLIYVTSNIYDIK